MISENKKSKVEQRLEMVRGSASLLGVVRNGPSGENCLWATGCKTCSGNSMCKGPEVGMNLMCSRNSQKTTMVEQPSQEEGGSR